MGNRLQELTWPEVGRGRLLVVPTGSCEQHGPHLPFDTDTRIALALSAALSDRYDRVSVAPPIAITASGEHQSFPGTLSIGSVAFEAVVVELCRSALPAAGQDLPSPFEGVLFVNGHGGNVVAFTNSVALLRSESRDVRVWHPVVTGGDSHAGRTETSLMLYLDDSSVRSDRIETGSMERWRQIETKVIESGLRSITANGVLGDPRAATAEEGRKIFEELANGLCRSAREWFPVLDVPLDDAVDGPGNVTP